MHDTSASHGVEGRRSSMPIKLILIGVAVLLILTLTDLIIATTPNGQQQKIVTNIAKTR